MAVWDIFLVIYSLRINELMRLILLLKAIFLNGSRMLRDIFLRSSCEHTTSVHYHTTPI